MYGCYCMEGGGSRLFRVDTEGMLEGSAAVCGAERTTLARHEPGLRTRAT